MKLVQAERDDLRLSLSAKPRCHPGFGIRGAHVGVVSLVSKEKHQCGNN